VVGSYLCMTVVLSLTIVVVLSYRSIKVFVRGISEDD